MGGKKWVCTTKLNAYRYIQFTISRLMLNSERFVEKGGGGRQWNVVQIVCAFSEFSQSDIMVRLCTVAPFY